MTKSLFLNIIVRATIFAIQTVHPERTKDENVLTNYCTTHFSTYLHDFPIKSHVKLMEYALCLLYGKTMQCIVYIYNDGRVSGTGYYYPHNIYA